MQNTYPLMIQEQVVGKAIFWWEGLRADPLNLTLSIGEQDIGESKIRGAVFEIRSDGEEVAIYERNAVGVFNLQRGWGPQGITPLGMFSQSSQGATIHIEDIDLFIPNAHLPVRMLWLLALTLRVLWEAGSLE